MSILEYLIGFTIFGAIFGLIDAVWLKNMRPLYDKELGSLLRAKPKMLPAVMFYGIYVVGSVVFVVVPAVQADVWWQGLVMGAIFGIVAYATYDLTNLATLKNWSAKIALIDIVWGGVVTAIASAVVTWALMQW